MVLSENAVGQRAVPQQLDGAMEIPLQPFGGDTRVGVVIQCFVHAGDRLHLLKHGADVVAHKDDSALFVDFRQQFVKARFEAFVDVRARLVENQRSGRGDDGSSQQGSSQLPAAQCPYGPVFQSFEPHAGNGLPSFFPLFGGEAGGEGLLYVQPRKNHLFHRDGEFAVDAVVLRQIAERRARGKNDFSLGRLEQTKYALYQCGLSASVRTDDAQKVTLVYGKIHIVKHGASVVSGRKVLYFDDGLHGFVVSAVGERACAIRSISSSQ